MRQPDFAANMPPSWKGPSQDSFSRGTPPQGESPNGTYNQGASRMLPDPRGYYARLGVEPFAAAETITAAYRRKARLVHPDVPVTGSAAAFMELKQAYDVLIHADRRAAYDRLAEQQARARHHGRPGERDLGEREPGEIGAMPFTDMTAPPTRHPRLRDLPVAVWAGMAVLLVGGLIEVGLHLASSPPPPRRDPIPATAWEVPPPAPNEALPPPYGPPPVRMAGTPNFYIVPTATPAVLWREDPARHALVPWGMLPPFSAVQGLRLFKANGMVEVKVNDSANGFVEAGRLTPGDAAAAARAWCTYNAGPTPENGEVLTHMVKGGATLSIDNRSGQPAVVKLRTPEGAIIASVFLGPDGPATLEGLPEGPARLDFATGEVWSRACHGFVAGMRARRLPAAFPIARNARLAIPPDAAVPVTELPDQAFEQE